MKKKEEMVKVTFVKNFFYMKEVEVELTTKELEKLKNTGKLNFKKNKKINELIEEGEEFYPEVDLLEPDDCKLEAYENDKEIKVHPPSEKQLEKEWKKWFGYKYK